MLEGWKFLVYSVADVSILLPPTLRFVNNETTIIQGAVDVSIMLPPTFAPNT